MGSLRHYPASQSLLLLAGFPRHHQLKKISTLFALFGTFYGVIFVIYKSKDDRKLPSMSFFTKTLSEIDFTFRWENWVTATDWSSISHESTANLVKLRMVYSWLRSITKIANYKPWLQVVGGIIYDNTVNDNIWLAITTDKAMDIWKKNCQL